MRVPYSERGLSHFSLNLIWRRL